MKVFVYWNLHKGLWSVKALSGPDKGRVVARVDKLTLANVTTRVSEAGRQRVLRERKKNVHAGIVGYTTITASFEDDLIQSKGRQITYNPYKNSTFVYMDGSEFHSADWAVLTPWRRVYTLGLPA